MHFWAAGRIYNVCCPFNIESRQLFDMEVSFVDCEVAEYQNPRSLIEWVKDTFRNQVGLAGQKMKTRSIDNTVQVMAKLL